MNRGVRRALGAGFACAMAVSANGAAAVDPAARDLARRQAEDILGERRFQDPDLPSPLKGPLTWIGERVESVIDAILDPLGLPGAAGWVILGAICVLLGVLVAIWLARRGSEATRPADGRDVSMRSASPDDLEREADACEEAGDHEAAVRLRFRAGLLRLAGDGVIPRARAITNREVTRRTGSVTFPRVAQSFDEIVYGERAPRADDLDLSRKGWADVRREAAGRSAAT